MITALSGAIYAGTGHSILDAIDPTFNPQIQTNSFGLKSVVNITPQPDGKILVSGFLILTIVSRSAALFA